ncbi:MAG: 4-oxalomesaconate tautomerase [Alphaproteobacteria bacterium]|nr:4-oxalomesaconate tautomerase [Alphaproteobacteria bacterium]MBU1516116.1 4-oxalomesaconate tautomerase [Alphaproteobacteria bacterium]MBU2092669.1 4-oxalomesaconate tautomerase [Alphaproteobacteria bacterium]MBU2153806.1 4-oxalomesaconate tautomerase [Alphaproteobacteria bacterium]MBU2308434.1 4-oxalomesaconate tautomerase [Alphaproteobacteria bacterium]
MAQTAIPCTVMRGGTSKGLYFLSRDLPADIATRDAVLLAAMGSPDARQIDGMGGAHPLTSKIAVVGPSTHPDADVDYLFLQAVVDEARIDAGQNCGNLLAGVGPFAIEAGLFAAEDGVTHVRINMLNTKSLAVAAIQTPGGKVRYDGDARIDGVPGTAAPVPIDFLDVAGSTCGALLPTGNARDVVQGIELTAIDNGMPVVVMRAGDFDKTGYETPEELEADTDLKARIEAIRLEIGPRMNLGDVAKKTVPKMCLVAPAQHGGAICTRNFIPHRVHEAIGVFGAVSVATACVTPGSVAAGVATVTDPQSLEVEHPTGFFTVAMDVTIEGGAVTVRRSALLRTCRRLMRGEVYVPASLWGGA